MTAKKPAPIVIQLKADGLKNVQSAFSVIGRSASALKSSVDAVGRSMMSIGKASAGAVVAVGAVKASIAAMTKAGIESVGEQARFAKQVGMTVEQYQELRYSAERSGMEVDALNGFLINLADKSIDAANGNMESAKQLADLGISALDASGKIKPMPRLFADLADAVAKMPDGTAKTGFLSILAGDDGARAIGLLNLGSKGLKKQADEARRLGNILPQTYVDVAKGASDASKQLRFTITSIRDELALLFAPGLEVSARKTTEFLGKHRKELVSAIQRTQAAVHASLDDLISVFVRGRTPKMWWVADLRDLLRGVGSEGMRTNAFRSIAGAIEQIRTVLPTLDRLGIDIKDISKSLSGLNGAAGDVMSSIGPFLRDPGDPAAQQALVRSTNDLARAFLGVTEAATPEPVKQIITGFVDFAIASKALRKSIDTVRLAYDDLLTIVDGGQPKLSFMRKSADMIRDVFALIDGRRSDVKSEWLLDVVDALERVGQAALTVTGVMTDFVNVLAMSGSEKAYKPLTRFGRDFQEFVNDVIGLVKSLGDGSTYEPATLLGKRLNSLVMNYIIPMYRIISGIASGLKTVFNAAFDAISMMFGEENSYAVIAWGATFYLVFTKSIGVVKGLIDAMSGAWTAGQNLYGWLTGPAASAGGAGPFGSLQATIATLKNNIASLYAWIKNLPLIGPAVAAVESMLLAVKARIVAFMTWLAASQIAIAGGAIVIAAGTIWVNWKVADYVAETEMMQKRIVEIEKEHGSAAAAAFAKAYMDKRSLMVSAGGWLNSINPFGTDLSPTEMRQKFDEMIVQDVKGANIGATLAEKELGQSIYVPATVDLQDVTVSSSVDEQLQKLDAGVEVNDVSISDSVKNIIGKIGAKLTSGGDQVSGYAGGGHVRGPGTGTSDSILARLSSGEFVMRAAAVRKWGVGILDALNRGVLPAFATGGLVSMPAPVGVSSAASMLRGGGGRPVVLQWPDGGETRVSASTDAVAEMQRRFRRATTAQICRKPSHYR